jgi:glycosyltransferase involved in cell wall biosynthesis
MRTILMIVHDFPPFGGGAVLRTLKYVKYLPEYGWRPVVLTVRPEDVFRSQRFRDPELLREVPDVVRIVRTPSLERWLRSSRAHEQQVAEGPPRTLASVWRGKLTAFLKRWYGYQDVEALWVGAATRRARRILKRHAVDVIYTTSPPHPTHLVGLMLARRRRCPWVVDFRDGWVDNPLFQAEARGRRALDLLLEGLVVRQASLITCATPYISEDLGRRHPQESAKFRVITNGFDPADFASLAPAPNPGVFTVAYLGQLSQTRSPRTFLAGLQEFLTAHPESRSRVRVRFIGGISDPCCRSYLESLEGVVEVIPALPHREALQLAISSDVLLLIGIPAEKQAVFTSKVFEYIACQRPILALITEGSLADMIIDKALGLVVAPTDAKAISQALQQLYDAYTEGELRRPYCPELLQRFDRKYLTRVLANELDSLVS